MRYSDLDKAALQAELSRVQQDYEALRGYKLNLNLTRGKPETAQLALSDLGAHGYHRVIFAPVVLYTCPGNGHLDVAADRG